MSEVILSMKDVTKIYNETKALDKVSIEINRITSKSRMKMGKPTKRLVMMRSMRWVT